MVIEASFEHKSFWVLYFYKKLECCQFVTLAKPFSCCLFIPSSLVVICYENTWCNLLHFRCLCSILWDSKTYREKRLWKTSFTVVQRRFVSKIYYEFALLVARTSHGGRTHSNSTFYQLLVDLAFLHIC